MSLLNRSILTQVKRAMCRRLYWLLKKVVRVKNENEKISRKRPKPLVWKGISFDRICDNRLWLKLLVQ